MTSHLLKLTHLASERIRIWIQAYLTVNLIVFQLLHKLVVCEVFLCLSAVAGGSSTNFYSFFSVKQHINAIWGAVYLTQTEWFLPTV